MEMEGNLLVGRKKIEESVQKWRFICEKYK